MSVLFDSSEIFAYFLSNSEQIPTQNSKGQTGHSCDAYDVQRPSPSRGRHVPVLLRECRHRWPQCPRRVYNRSSLLQSDVFHVESRVRQRHFRHSGYGRTSELVPNKLKNETKKNELLYSKLTVFAFFADNYENCIYMAFVGMGLDGTSKSLTEYVGRASNIRACSEYVLNAYPEAWAVSMANPYEVDGIQAKSGSSECKAVLGSFAKSEISVGDDPQQMLCFLRGTLPSKDSDLELWRTFVNSLTPF